MKRSKEKISEAELCRRFIAYAEPQGWKAYAETGGWDIVLVKDGVQIGVQAKLRFNATLMRQLLPGNHGRRGPNYIAALLPNSDSDVSQVLEQCGVIYFYPHNNMQWDDRITQYAPLDLGLQYRPQWDFEEQIELPEYLPDVPAGDSAPVQLTPWKVGALRLFAMIEHQGFATKNDMDRILVNPRFFVQSEWIAYDRHAKRYIKGPKEPRAVKQHPQVYQQILDEIRLEHNPRKAAP